MEVTLLNKPLGLRLSEGTCPVTTVSDLNNRRATCSRIPDLATFKEKTHLEIVLAVGIYGWREWSPRMEKILKEFKGKGATDYRSTKVEASAVTVIRQLALTHGSIHKVKFALKNGYCVTIDPAKLDEFYKLVETELSKRVQKPKVS